MSIETIRVVRRFQATAERVFEAWFDPQRAGKFLFATPHGVMQSVQLDTDGFRIVERRDGKDYVHVGRFVTVEAPQLVSFAFAAGVDGEPLGAETSVRVEITPLASGCEVMLSQEGVPSSAAEQAKHGWATILANLDHNVRPDT